MASLSGTFTAAQQRTTPLLYLRATETVRTTLTVTGSVRVQLCRSLGPNMAVEPIETYTASGTYDWVNTTDTDQHLLLLCVSVAGSTAYTFADVAGDQILQEWRSADGTLVARVTDEGFVGAINVVDVRLFGAVGDGVADDAVALQAAITATPEGGELLLTGGVFKSSVGLTVNKPMTIRGVDNRNTNLPDSDSRSLLTFSADVAAGITTTANLRLSSIVVNGIGLGASNGTGVVATSASVILENVLIQAWDTGLDVDEGYYNKMVNSRIDYCKIAAKFDNCYNIAAFGTAFNGRQESGARSVDLLNGSAGSFHACSFESWRASGIALYAGASAALFGCYFEGTPEVADTGRCVILASGTSVSAVGCHVYLTQNVEQWIGVESGATTGVRVFSRNNRLIYPTNSDIVDVYVPVADATACWDVAGDNWQSDAGGGCRYVEPTFTGSIPAVGAGQFRFVYPANFSNQTSHIDTVLRPYAATAAPTVASASTIALPLDVGVVTISGTTGIATITATNHARHRVTLIFSGILTVTDGSNLRLNGNFTTSADDTLTLVCDGTNWYEVARSAN